MEDDIFKDPKEFLESLENCKKIKNEAEAAEVVNRITLILKNINEGKAKQWKLFNIVERQTMLRLAFRTYKSLISKYNLNEDLVIVEQNIAEQSDLDFELLYAFLQSTDVNNFQAESMLEACLKSLTKCEMQKEENQINIILRTTNLLLRKQPYLAPGIKMRQLYGYLQNNHQGIREETLMLFSNCCKSLASAQSYFQIIIEYYPWTNRNKYLLLSCILENSHKLEGLLQQTGQSAVEFFQGLRLSLAYKRLLSPSQCLVKSLSRQECFGLLELAATILIDGTFKEITNFHANWFNRISQKETLLKLLYERLDIDVVLENFKSHTNPTEEHRFILIFSLYCRQIFDTSKLDFFRISTELLTNCFRFQVETQLLIYKFVVDNLNSFALEDILEFLAAFIIEHRNVENAQIRNNILGKISNIINYVAKSFKKAHKKSIGVLNTLNVSILDFFNKLNHLIENEIASKIYQPKIYTLKLLEILLKSLYQEGELERNAKNCIVLENDLLSKFLLAKGCFDSKRIAVRLVDALNDPKGFDDALDLVVQFLKRMPSVLSAADLMRACKKCCESVDIDECNLSFRYAVALTFNPNENKSEDCMALQKYALNKLCLELTSFQADPLDSCKTRCHIFGLLNVINVTITIGLSLNESRNPDELIDLLELIVNLILELLLRSPSKNKRTDAPVAADFQDMDESLEMLVKNSNFSTENNEECRKFLLMSFWLTLKACCDTATTLGKIFADHEKVEIDCEKLQRCLNINVAVLTRCRHKGAIEAAGLSIGKLTKHITSHKTQLPVVNKIICNALSLLFLNENLVSTTRRGAGFSIMLLHIVKNDEQIEKPILKYALHEIFQRLRRTSNSPLKQQANNCDRIEALSLHYLCVLAKDAELRDAVSMYRNEIILLAIRKIDDPEWTICNAALQLFGALIPKIVGQKQATEMELVESVDWEPASVTFYEIASSMPETFKYILNYCREHANESLYTRSIILFLGFLSKLEHLAQDDDDDNQAAAKLRELMWSLLHHREEKVRKLSALVFVRAHEFCYELPQVLLIVSGLLFSIRNENFFEGLIFVIQTGVLKMRSEALHTISSTKLTEFLQQIRLILNENYIFKSEFKLYTQFKLLKMLLSIGFDNQSLLIAGLLKSLETNFNSEYNELLTKFESKQNKVEWT